MTSGHRETAFAVSKALGYKARQSCQALLGARGTRGRPRFFSLVAPVQSGQLLNQTAGGDGLVMEVLFSFHSDRLGQVPGKVNLQRKMGRQRIKLS